MISFCPLLLATVVCAAWDYVACIDGDLPHQMPRFGGRSLQSESMDTCYSNSAATVNTTFQIEAGQQLEDQHTQPLLLAALSQYLRAAECNINLTYTASTVCPALHATNSTNTCTNGQYICRGVTQVAQNVYSAVQNSQCSPDSSGSTVSCQGAELDLTTYLSIQQGQCCLQCPGQPDCTTDNSQVAQSTEPSAYNCGNFAFSVAVGSSLEGSSIEDLLNTAVSGGLLNLYLQTSGLEDASALSVGPTGQHHMPGPLTTPLSWHDQHGFAACHAPR